MHIFVPGNGDLQKLIQPKLIFQRKKKVVQTLATATSAAVEQ
jgi:hypothetical protein